MSLKIDVYKSNKQSIKQPLSVQSGVLPKLHCSYLIVGRSGSGKSNVLIHMLNSPSLLKGAFDDIYYCIGSVDDTFSDNVKIKKQNIISDFNEDKIRNILNKQEADIKKNGYVKASSALLIFDDILSRPRFLKSDIILKLVSECRHYNISCIFNTQSYTKIPRALRINCRGIVLFPSSAGELNRYAEEQALPNMSKKQFLELIKYATKDQYNFAFLNLDAPPNERLRKNFDKILNYN